jgi:hypothetical protein
MEEQEDEIKKLNEVIKNWVKISIDKSNQFCMLSNHLKILAAFITSLS